MKPIFGFGRKFLVFVIALVALFLAALLGYDGIYLYIVSLAAAFITGNAVQNFAFTNRGKTNDTKDA